jgi:hypothetical protein
MSEMTTDRDRLIHPKRRIRIGLAFFWLRRWFDDIRYAPFTQRKSGWSTSVAKYVGDELNDPNANLD